MRALVAICRSQYWNKKFGDAVICNPLIGKGK